MSLKELLLPAYCQLKAACTFTISTWKYPSCFVFSCSLTWWRALPPSLAENTTGWVLRRLGVSGIAERRRVCVTKAECEPTSTLRKQDVPSDVDCWNWFRVIVLYDDAERVCGEQETEIETDLSHHESQRVNQTPDCGAVQQNNHSDPVIMVF